VTKLLIFSLSSELFSDFLRKVAFIYIDNTSKLPLDDLCNSLKITLIKKDVKKIDVRDRGYTVSNQLSELMNQLACDYLFVFGSQLLKEPLLSHYKYRIINFHPSLLPAFPGIKAIDKAIEYGSFVTGNTAHFIDEGIDTGPIIMQNICVIEDWEGYDIILDKQIPMVLQIADWLESKRIYISGRRVRISGASYKLSEYIPNLEFKLECFEGSYEIK